RSTIASGRSRSARRASSSRSRLRTVRRRSTPAATRSTPSSRRCRSGRRSSTSAARNGSARDREAVVSNRYDPGDLEPVTAPEPRTLPSEHDRSRRSLLGRIAAPVAVALGVLVKFGAIGLKFFGIFLAVGGYALIWGWKFGVGVVLLILVHELGHYVEAKRLGLDPQLPVFIPFLGAYVALRNMRFVTWVNA